MMVNLFVVCVHVKAMYYMDKLYNTQKSLAVENKYNYSASFLNFVILQLLYSLNI